MVSLYHIGQQRLEVVYAAIFMPQTGCSGWYQDKKPWTKTLLANEQNPPV